LLLSHPHLNLPSLLSPGVSIIVTDLEQIVNTAKKNIAEAQRRLAINFGPNVLITGLRAIMHVPSFKLTMAGVDRLIDGTQANDSLMDAMISLV
jgi:hypothetical protein